MARRNPPARWVLPATVDPAGRKCIQVMVPDDPAHIAAFRGAMLSLASAYNWADDPAHTAKDVALVWRAIVDDMTEWGCGTDIQFRACVEGCGIEYSTDGGENWTCIDITACIANVADERIAAWYDANRQDGTIPGAGAQGSDGAPQPNVCYDYEVQLNGNGIWLLPIAVDEGDTIEIENVNGVWWDGNEFGFWYCIDGHYFFVNACQNGSRTEAGDPLNTVNHMALVGQIDGVFFEALAGVYSVPAGVFGGQLFLQANDTDLSDNQGAANFRVHVCKTTCTYSNFIQQAGAWEVSDDPAWSPAPGVYTLGTGYVSVNTNRGGPNRTDCEIIPVGSYSYHNPTIIVKFHVTTMGNQNTMAVTCNGSTQTANWTGTGDQTMSFGYTGDITDIIVDGIPSFNAWGGQIEITEVGICA